MAKSSVREQSKSQFSCASELSPTNSAYARLRTKKTHQQHRIVGDCGGLLRFLCEPECLLQAAVVHKETGPVQAVRHRPPMAVLCALCRTVSRSQLR